jgi:glutathione S-transferase
MFAGPWYSRSMKLFGTRTSPYVRRVRVVAQELGVPVELVETVSDDGQAALRAVTPLWKIPVAQFGDEAIFDSHVIVDRLLADHGYGPLRSVAPADRWREANLMSMIDGGLDTAINQFYFTRDGVSPDQAQYLAKQRDRVHSAMSWVESQFKDGYAGADQRFGLAELALVTTCEWMQFRGTYDVSRHPGLLAAVERHKERPSLASTRPGE